MNNLLTSSTPVRTSLLTVISLLTLLHTGVTFAGAADGKAIFEKQKCAGCHQVSGPGKMVPVSERGKIKGPPLWFAGSKFKPQWLAQWLEKPTPIRRIKYGTLEEGTNDHLALAGADAKAVGDYLTSLTDASVKTGTLAAKKLKRRKKLKAHKLFAKKQVCFGCHQYPAKKGPVGGFSGPSLLHAGDRLQLDWILAYIKDPVRYYPNGRMPVYGDKAFEPYSEAELKLLAQYVGGM